MTKVDEINFPIYPCLLTESNPSRNAVEEGFRAAQTGDDEALYRFVLGVQGVALHCLGENGLKIPGVTQEVAEKTFQSSRAVFEELASRNHLGAQTMVGYYDANGLGLKPRTSPATNNPSTLKL